MNESISISLACTLQIFVFVSILQDLGMIGVVDDFEDAFEDAEEGEYSSTLGFTPIELVQFESGAVYSGATQYGTEVKTEIQSCMHRLLDNHHTSFS